MKAKEYSKKGFLSTKFSLGVTIAPDEELRPDAEWQEAVTVIKEWKADRGKKVGFVMLTLLGNEQVRRELEELVKATSREDPAFKGLKLEINFFDENGESVNKLVL